MYHTPSSVGDDSSAFLSNRQALDRTRNQSVFKSGRQNRVDSAADGEVFKSKFIREYYNVLLDDI